jgi:hypothetical protein
MTTRKYESIILHVRKAYKLYSANSAKCKNADCSKCVFITGEKCLFPHLRNILNTADQAMLLAPPSHP